MVTNEIIIARPWMKSGFDSLSIQSNPFTYFVFRQSSTYSVSVVDAVPIDQPATSKPHVLEKVKTFNYIVGLRFVVACRHAVLCNDHFFIRYFLKQRYHIRGNRK